MHYLYIIRKHSLCALNYELFEVILNKVVIFFLEHDEGPTHASILHLDRGVRGYVTPKSFGSEFRLCVAVTYYSQ